MTEPEKKDISCQPLGDLAIPRVSAGHAPAAVQASMKMPEQFRTNSFPPYLSNKGDPYGMFLVPSSKALGRTLKILATDGDKTGWNHVSVSLPDWQKKQPSWMEMCLVKDLFWDENQCVVQFHPPKSDYVNNHPGVLHLWRLVKGEFPMPPKICV